MVNYTYVASYLAKVNSNEMMIYNVIIAPNDKSAKAKGKRYISKLEKLPNIEKVHTLSSIRKVKEVTLEDVVDPSLYLKKLNNRFVF